MDPKDVRLKNLRKPFAKGESGNPSGRPKEDPVLKQIKRLTKEELKDIGALVLKGNVEDLKRVRDDKTASVLKVAIASVAVKAIGKGDMESLDKLLNRLIGKVKDEVEHSGNLPAAAQTVNITIPSNGREVKKS